MRLSFPLFLFLWTAAVRAGSFRLGQSCEVKYNTLLAGTFQFYSQCNSQTYCNSITGVCEKRGCRRADFPFGYSQGDKGIPSKCPVGQFCPDEEDACQPLLPVGSACQLNRDDQCQAPPNHKKLADTSKRGYNFNGSVCLNNICMWANVTESQPCVVENTPYVGYSANGQIAEFIDIVSRGNCELGNYCDAQKLVCMKNKLLNEPCGADKECDSFNCPASGICGQPADLPNNPPSWVFVVAAFSIILGMSGTLVGMYSLHRKQRDRERQKRSQYWHEQNAFRQNILLMRDLVSQVLAGNPLPTRRGFNYSRDVLSASSAADSQVHVMQYTPPKSSALRYNVSDDGFEYEGHDTSTPPLQIERCPDGKF